MLLKLSGRDWSPQITVFAPMVVLTLIFAGLMASVVSRVGAVPGDIVSTVAVGLVFYSIAIVMLVRAGLANIAKLELLGLTDSLSHLPNRRALHFDIQRDADAKGETALALIDLDGFKLVNDHYGHFVGDRLIKGCADLLRDVCGEEARIYRLGGDEFAILVTGDYAGNILEGICRMLLTRMTGPFRIDERAIVVGASIGLSRSTGADALSSTELLRRSDVAMYAAKRAGKMRCTWFNGGFDSDREKVREIEHGLRQALARDQFRVHYQPLVDVATKEVVAVEALLRWNRTDGKHIGPDQFIPIAEESGLINAIGLWVLRQACTDALNWNGIELSVNVSAVQLRNPEFPILLGQVLDETGFPPSRLELEVTETYLVLDPEVARRSFDAIRNFGVRIVLDDFGTGYASIGYLRQFAFEKLKIDRSLIVDAATDEGSRAMMLASIAVARALNMDVTVEGVETQAQADLARIAGCDQIQGWLYYKAMSAEDISTHFVTREGATASSNGFRSVKAA